MAFDVAHVRGLFPSLGDGWVHLDPQAGMQIPDAVATAVSTGFRQLVASPGGVYPQARRSAEVVDGARRAIGDLLLSDPAGVVFGPSRSALLTTLTASFPSGSWLGRDVVISRQDDEPNIVPWLRAVDRFGGRLRWAEVDIESAGLPAWQYDDLITERTAIVTLPVASSVTGAVADVAAIAKRAHAVGALVVVDASGAAPYVPLDIGQLDADILIVSAERWGGPRISAMAFRDPAAIDRLVPVAADASVRGPQRLEAEPVQGALLAGLVASVEHLATLDEQVIGKRRQRLVAALDGVYEYLQRLTYYLVDTLGQLNQVNIVGAPENRMPTLSFTVAGVSADKVVRRLADNGICALADYPSRALRMMGVGDFGGAVSLGLAPYSTPYEVDHLVRTLGSLG